MHANARLTVHARRDLVHRVTVEGHAPAEVARQLRVSRATVYKWLRRHREEGEAGLFDRSSRPHRTPTKTSPSRERRILDLRRRRKLGPARIALLTGVPSSTVWRVLVRHGLNRLAWMDRPTGRVVRRYEKTYAGELVHLDIKKIARVPSGGGWRIHGRGKAGPRRRVGYGYLHVAVDDYSRVAYVEMLDDEQATTAVGFYDRARRWFQRRGVTIDAVMSDNGSCYRSRLFRDHLAGGGTKHRFTRAYRPQTNGKAERFIRTMCDESLYARRFRSDADRTRRLARWQHRYNMHRQHTAVGGAPITRVDNLPGSYT